jgi:xanthine dehydrogenase molybdenum-binding subunit
MADFSVLRTSVPRVDALDKVTGKAQFSADIILPGMLYAKALRSPFPHARIKRLDTSKAKSLKGVKAVITSADVPGLKDTGEVFNCMLPTLAKDRVIFEGQPVAAVAAETLYIAEEALDLIEVEYEPLPYVLDVLEAMKPEAPLVYHTVCNKNVPGRENTPANVFLSWETLRGDTEKAFKESDVVLENTYRTQTVHQGHLEPRAAVVDIDLHGKLTVWTDNQGIFKARELIAEFVKLPLNMIKVMPAEVGGAFGGKEHQQLSPLAALLALKSRRPVKMVMTREEVFKCTRPGASTVFNVKMGVTRDGRLLAIQSDMIYDYGINTGMPGMGALHFAFSTGISLYNVPNLKINCYDVMTHKAPSGPYRAPTAIQVAFAVESQIDLMARAIGMDPLEFRYKNASVEGDAMVDGSTFGKIGFKQTILRMQKYLAGHPAPKGRNQGRGVAAGLWATGCMGSAAHVNVNGDGTVAVVVGSTDVSGTRTTLAQMAAEEFGIPFSDITIIAGDTETAAFSIITAGSMTTRSMGKAVYRACLDAKAQLCQKAAQQLKLKVDDLEYTKGRVQVKSQPDKFLTIAELARESFGSSGMGPITGRGSGESMGEGTPVFAVQAADIEVDKETGKIKILNYAVAQDTGVAVNPKILEGQMQGAVSQGIGWAVTEGYYYQDGLMKNSTFLDYRMPTAADLPYIQALLVEEASGTEPFNIRGAGEPPIVPTLGAMANAVHSAAGVRLTSTPMTPEAVLKMIKNQ